MNIIFWIKNNIPGAERIELTLDESRMAKYPVDSEGKVKYPQGSYLKATALPVKKTNAEATPGFFWRGYEGIKKLGDSLDTGLIYSQEKFDSQKYRMVMYVMNHGFIKVPRSLIASTGIKEPNQISTIHDTAFIHDLLPGSSQFTSTGIGHFQDLGLDIKYVTEGSGIQFNVRYDTEGNVQEVLAHYLTVGTWTLALPGYVDYMINLGGLRFSDFSVVLSEQDAAEISPNFDFRHRVVVAEAINKNVKMAPYYARKYEEQGYQIVIGLCKSDEEG